MPITVDGVTYANVGDWNRAMDAQAVAAAPSMLPSTAATSPRDLAVSPDLMQSPLAPFGTAARVPPASPAAPGAAATGPSGRDPLDIIERFESGGRNIMQQAVPAGGGYNPSVGRVTGPSTASGYWQITNSTWRGTAPKVGVDVSQYPTAMSAPREIQRAVAQQLFKEHGYAPWAPFNSRLAQAVGWKGMSAGGALPYARDSVGGVGAAPTAPAPEDAVSNAASPGLSRAMAPISLQLEPQSAAPAASGAAPVAQAMRPMPALQPIPLSPAPNLYGGYQDALASILNGQRRGMGAIFG